MSERATRKSEVADIVGVVFYSVIALLLTLAWMYVPPEAVISVCRGLEAPIGLRRKRFRQSEAV